MYNIDRCPKGENWYRWGGINENDFAKAQGLVMRDKDSDSSYCILSDGVEVARWEPGTGWRYWRSSRSIAEWRNNNPPSDSDGFDAKFLGSYGWVKSGGWNFIENAGEESLEACLERHHYFKDAANAYLDAHGLLLPEGAMPAGLTKVEKAPVDVTHGWTPRSIAEWYLETSVTPWTKGFCERLGHYWIKKEDLWSALHENPSFFHAACAWLESHGVNAPITIKEAPMATQKSPIFGIKLACGSQIGFQKMEGGSVVIRTAGPSLDGQRMEIGDDRKLYERATAAFAWNPNEPADEWRF